MKLGWFAEFFESYVQTLDREVILHRVKAHLSPWTTNRKNSAKRWIYINLHQRGVAYGLPLGPATPQPGDTRGEFAQPNTRPWQDALVPFLSIWIDLAIEVDTIMRGTTRGDDLELWLLSCFLLQVDLDAPARQLFLPAGKPKQHSALLSKAMRQIEQGLDKRRAAAANPLLGLPLRNAFVYSDARMFARIALTLAEKQRIDDTTVAKLRSYFWRERHLQVVALGALAAGPEGLGPEGRKFAMAQISKLGLAREETRELRKLLDSPMSPEDVAFRIRGHREAGYLLEQLAVAAMIDGTFDPHEQDFMARIATKLHIPPPTLHRIEGRVWRFVSVHRDDYDRYTETQYYGKFGSRIEKTLVAMVQNNLGPVVTEIRQTGELAGLLTKAAAGHNLSDDDRKQMREQLLDILRAVPSLAIFALPGGALLLPIVLKLLPWDLRPTAFRK